MTRETTDNDTAEQVIESFRVLAGDKVELHIPELEIGSRIPQKLAFKIRNFDQKSIFFVMENRNFDQKSIFSRKIEILIKNRFFSSKIESLTKTRFFHRKSKV